MKAYPVEFRQRIVALTAEGMDATEIAEVLGVTATWVRIIRRLHESGQPLDVKSSRNKRRSLAEREGERIRAHIEAKPSITLEDLKRELKLDTSISNLWNALQTLKLSFKKTAPRGRARTSRRCPTAVRMGRRHS